MATVKSSTKSYDGGKWQLIVNYKISSSGVSVKPYIKITSATKSTHTLSLTWTKRGKTTKKTKVKSKGSYLKPSSYGTCKAMSCKVTAKVGSSKISLTIKTELKPSAPKIKVKYNNDFSATLTYSGKAYTGKNVTGFVIQRQMDEVNADWEDVASPSVTYTSDYSRTYTDQQIEPGHRYRWKVGAKNSNGTTNTTTDWIYTLPPDLDNVEHTRVSDYQCDVAITRDREAVARDLLTKISIQRNDNGSKTWTEIAKASVGSSKDTIVHYKDKTCQPDHFYRYRAAGINSRGTSKVEAPSESGTEPTYNTPAAPISIKATYGNDGNVNLDIKNEAHTATALEIQKSLTGSLWYDLETVDETEELCTSYVDKTGSSGDTVYYRARNIREGDSKLVSAYTNSGAVSTLLRPNPPTLASPLNNSPVTLNTGTVRLVWVHNPQDGTEQMEATVYYRLSTESSWHTHKITDSTSYWDMELDPSYLSAGAILYWKVQTKGQHAQYSVDSEVYTIKIITKPSIKFISPANGDTINNLPLTLGFDYSDASGELAQLTLQVIRDDEVEYTVDIPLESISEYDFSEFLFTNESAYQLMVTAISTSGLSETATLGIYVSYVSVELEEGVTISVDVDEDNGYAYVMIETEEAAGNIEEESSEDEEPDEDVEDEGDEDEADEEDAPAQIVKSPPDRSYLYRVIDDVRVLIASDLHAGDQVTDKYAPLNREFGYELLTIAKNGAIALDNYSAFLDSRYWFCYWGEDNIAKALWNPSGETTVGRPEKTQVRYSGRDYPVSYDSSAKEKVMRFSAHLDDYDELQNFIRLMDDGGQGVWKSCDGDVYKADFDFSYSSDYTKLSRGWDMSLTATRIDSEDL